jgi:hypothetical protein
LASAIEELQEANPTLSFESALQKVYARFPITGFWSTMIKGRKEALLNFWSARFFSYFISFFTLPKILITIAIGLSAFVMYDYLVPVFKYFYWILIALGLYFSFTNQYLRKLWTVLFLAETDILNEYFGQKIGKEEKSYLVLESFVNRTRWVYIILVLVWLFYFSSPSLVEVTMGFKVFSAVLFSTTIILINGLFIEMPKMLARELEEKYQHLNLKLA